MPSTSLYQRQTLYAALCFPLKIRPLAFAGLLLQALPAKLFGQRLAMNTKKTSEGGGQNKKNLHFGLEHNINQLVLTFGNLNNLLDEASADLVLNLRDPTPR